MKEITDIYVLATANLNRPTGDTVRILSLVSELAKAKKNVNLVTPKPLGNFAIDLQASVNTKWLENYLNTDMRVPIFLNNIKKLRLLNKITKKIQKSKNLILQVEHSIIGGYLSNVGRSNYILDVHGMSFDEVNYNKIPNHIPSKLYQSYVHFLEGKGIKHASKVIAVSNPMKEFIITEWKVSEEKIEVIPNGYFEDKIKRFENIKETDRIVSFIGLLERWANVDKVIEAANSLKNDNMSFYIVGDGPDRGRLEQMVKKYDLNNVKFTGFMPIDEAYKIMAKSKILLAPFPKTLALEVACPIKLLEYMAFGKPMVIDNVGEVPAILNENKAALLSNPLNQNEFFENIRMLLDDSQLRRKISVNAKKLSKNYTWEKQGEKLARMYDDISKR